MLGRHAYVHAAGKVYRGNNADDSAIDSLIRISGGVRISRHIPDPATNDQALIISKAPASMSAVAPIWQGESTLIPDEVTKATHGQIVVTAILLHAVKIIRAGAFVRKELQLGIGGRNVRSLSGPTRIQTARSRAYRSFPLREARDRSRPWAGTQGAVFTRVRSSSPWKTPAVI